MWFRDFKEIEELIFINTGAHMRNDLKFLIKYISSALLVVLFFVSIP